MAVGDRLKALREHHGLTVDDLAELSEIHPTTIYKLESGSTERVHATTADALAAALYVEVQDIFDKSDITEKGRAAHTGGNYTSPEDRPLRQVCPNCHLELLPCGLCPECGG